MPLFRKQKIAINMLPSDIARKMELFGQFEIDPTHADSSVAMMAAKLVPELHSVAAVNPDAFINEVAAAVLPHGGWALYGGVRLVKETTGMRSQNPDYLRMFDAAAEFLRDQGFEFSGLSERELWHEMHPGEEW